MKEVKKYKMLWNTKANEGILTLDFGDGKSGEVLVDSPQEGSLLLDILRNEKPVYYRAEHFAIFTGLEAVGEGDEKADDTPGEKVGG